MNAYAPKACNPLKWRGIIPRGPVPERDHTCPDCKGEKVDRNGFDCRTCFGEGIVDE